MKIMNHETQLLQCPNCWGYQEYDEQYPDRIACTCKIENN